MGKKLKKQTEKMDGFNIKLVRSYVKHFSKMINKNHIAACAAQAAFFILLSAVPLITLVLAIGTYLPFSQQDVIDVIMRVIPNDLISYVREIIGDLYNGDGKSVISFSAVAILWAASKGILALSDGFNSMYEIKIQNRFIRLRVGAVLNTIFLILIFVIIMSAYVTIGYYYKTYIQNSFEMKWIMKSCVVLLKYIAGCLLFYAFIVILFVMLPGGFGLPIGKEKRKDFDKRVKEQLPGAAFAAIAWMIISKLVGVYIHYFPNFSVTYGSLAGIAIIMLWLYFCMYSIFMGAVINHILSKGYLTQVKKMLK